MADETTDTPDAVTDVEKVETAVTDTDTQPAQIADEGSDGAFTPEQQKRVDAIVKQRLDRANAKATTAAKKAADVASAAALAEQGKFKELYEIEAAKVTAAAAQVQALELANLRRDIAAKVGIPAALATRLQGADADEIEADAKILLTSLPKPAAPSLDGGKGKDSKNGTIAPTEAEIRETAARLNVSAKHLAEHHGVTLSN